MEHLLLVVFCFVFCLELFAESYDCRCILSSWTISCERGQKSVRVLASQACVAGSHFAEDPIISRHTHCCYSVSFKTGAFSSC